MLECQNLNLDDQQISRILKVFLSSDTNRLLTSVIELRVNQLTKVPSEISQFKRLQKVSLAFNKITSLNSGELFDYSSADSVDGGNRRSIQVDLAFNQLNYIESGAIEGDIHFIELNAIVWWIHK